MCVRRAFYMEYCAHHEYNTAWGRNGVICFNSVADDTSVDSTVPSGRRDGQQEVPEQNTTST